MRTCVVLLMLLVVAPVRAQTPRVHAADRVIEFPDVPGFRSLTCDFHIHTVFSDGSVWPSIRVQEAQRDGLDCIALTEHLEYQPHKDDIPHPDRNRSYALSVEAAGEGGLIVVKGSEITRDMPPGHANAIFIQDANRLLMEDSVAVFREVARQGGFAFWNHPNWTAQRADGVATLTDLHRMLIAEGLLDGIEVVNDLTYSDEALQIALDYNLAILGTSDIHGLVDWQFEVPEGGHRPITIVFARERTAAGIREALDARRTAAWFNDLLIGREAQVLPLVAASLYVERAVYGGDSSVLEVTLANASDAPYRLLNRSPYTFHAHADVVDVPPHGFVTLEVKTGTRLGDLTLSFDVLNAVVAPRTHPRLDLAVAVEE